MTKIYVVVKQDPWGMGGGPVKAFRNRFDAQDFYDQQTSDYVWDIKELDLE